MKTTGASTSQIVMVTVALAELGVSPLSVATTVKLTRVSTSDKFRLTIKEIVPVLLSSSKILSRSLEVE